jgi:hypothetical protein
MTTKESRSEAAHEPAAAQLPSIGRIVHFVMPSGNHRPAIVVNVTAEGSSRPTLQIFTDSKNDHPRENIHQAHDVEYDEHGAFGTWHWPERV